MISGVPREAKVEEYRVGAPPTAVDTLVRAGHQVLVETKAGLGSGFEDPYPFNPDLDVHGSRPSGDSAWGVLFWYSADSDDLYELTIDAICAAVN